MNGTRVGRHIQPGAARRAMIRRRWAMKLRVSSARRGAAVRPLHSRWQAARAPRRRPGIVITPTPGRGRASPPHPAPTPAPTPTPAPRRPRRRSLGLRRRPTSAPAPTRPRRVRPRPAPARRQQGLPRGGRKPAQHSTSTAPSALGLVDAERLVQPAGRRLPEHREQDLGAAPPSP